MKRLFIILVLITAVYSCDIFSTRDPEDPNTARSDFLTATTPDILFQNLITSLKDKVVDNYMRVLADTVSIKKRFIFIPSAGAISKFPSLAQWDLDSEERYFNNVKVSTIDGASIDLTLENTSSIIQADSAVFQFNYNLSVPFSDGGQPGIYQGSVEFRLNLNVENQWVITRWEDIKKDDLPSWSELKGQFN